MPSKGHRKAEVGYVAVHVRLVRERGAAKTHTCVCGKQAYEWAYLHTAKVELSSPRGVYSLNPDDYLPLCRKCHRAFDSTKW